MSSHAWILPLNPSICTTLPISIISYFEVPLCFSLQHRVTEKCDSCTTEVSRTYLYQPVSHCQNYWRKSTQRSKDVFFPSGTQRLIPWSFVSFDRGPAWGRTLWQGACGRNYVKRRRVKGMERVEQKKREQNCNLQGHDPFCGSQNLSFHYSSVAHQVKSQSISSHTDEFIAPWASHSTKAYLWTLYSSGTSTHDHLGTFLL